MKKLTELQIAVLRRMRNIGLEFVAAATQHHWLDGERYYIDDRCRASKTLRRDYERCNKIAEGK